MIEKLEKLLQEKYEYELKEKAVFEISDGKSKLIPVTSSIFGVFVVLYLLELFGIFPNFMNLGLLFFIGLVLILIPLALQRGVNFNAIIITPRFIIQRIAKSEFVVIEFDNISGFQIGKEGVIITQGKKRIVLGTDLFREELESIIDILEAKGKTFDKSKEYMIRPIIITIKDNKISIEDNETETDTEKLYVRYNDDYEMLTPGFIEEIIFRNSAINDAEEFDGNLVLKLDSFEVKGGHPENTTFEIITALDGIMIFESVELKELCMQDLNTQEKDEDIPLDLQEIVSRVDKAVISHWKLNKKQIEIFFATGVHMLRANFTFDEVIIGWNSQK